jgi:hypothetical protein
MSMLGHASAEDSKTQYPVRNHLFVNCCQVIMLIQRSMSLPNHAFVNECRCHNECISPLYTHLLSKCWEYCRLPGIRTPKPILLLFVVARVAVNIIHLCLSEDVLHRLHVVQPRAIQPRSVCAIHDMIVLHHGLCRVVDELLIGMLRIECLGMMLGAECLIRVVTIERRIRMVAIERGLRVLSAEVLVGMLSIEPAISGLWVERILIWMLSQRHPIHIVCKACCLAIVVVLVVEVILGHLLDLGQDVGVYIHVIV